MASEIKVDTVSEKTSANGVTIDGLNIKDSKLVTANSVIEANMSANSVDSDSYVDGSIDTAHIADLNVTTGKIAADAITAAKIADNAVVTAGINADAVTGAKIADDAINSEHYTDGSIDTAHIADGQVTTAKLATALFTGATDIGAAIADADLFLMDDGAGGTIRKTAASRIKTYAGGTSFASTYFDVRMSADQAISSSTDTKVDFDTEVADVGGNFDTSTQKYTAPSAGTYVFNAGVHIASASDGQMKVSKLFFRSTPSGGSDVDLVVSHEDNESSRHRRNSHKVSFLRTMAANEVIFVLGNANVSAGTPNFLHESGNHLNFFQGYRVA